MGQGHAWQHTVWHPCSPWHAFEATNANPAVAHDLQHAVRPLLLLLLPVGLPGKDTLFIADVDAARSILAAELQLGVGADWPETIRK